MENTFKVQYAIHHKSSIVIKEEEVEEKSHLDAAWKLQQQVKNELDPYGNKGVNVLVNLNPPDPEQ